MIDCPLCGAWANVLQTRHNKTTNKIRRRYECANEHRFSTVEEVDVRAVSATRVSRGRPAVHDCGAVRMDH